MKYDKSVLLFYFILFFQIFNFSCSGSGSKSSSQVDSSGDSSQQTENASAKICNKNINGTTDPYFNLQWHLENTGQLGGDSGEDINVKPVWSGGNKGEGVTISIVDDGLDINHEDICENILYGQSYNFSDGTTNPGTTSTNHGTRVGGVIAARDLNDLGGKGVAPRANLVGSNFLKDGNSTTTNLSTALNRNVSDYSVISNSWGSSDNKGQFYPPPSKFSDILNTGINSGRKGKGIVYVWAAGNGGRVRDEANYDGIVNMFPVMSICAVGDDGVRAIYSEKGANLWVCAPSEGDSGVAIMTTKNNQSSESNNFTNGFNEFGKDENETLPSRGESDLEDVSENLMDNLIKTDFDSTNYTKTFNGTSASAPMVSGVAALVLKANPNLSWRDVKIILAKTARKNDPSNTDWAVNGGNFNINHSYGFGVVDAEEAVKLAPNFNSVGTLVTKTYQSTVSRSLLDGATQTNTISISDSQINYIEYVEITVTINHSDWGELKIELDRTSEFSTYNKLSSFHYCLNDKSAVTNCKVQGDPQNVWTFGSARHLGESANGNWRLSISEIAGSYTNGQWLSWSLKIYGH
jgi:proprotein convertase subtilisin/kexin type 2